MWIFMRIGGRHEHQFAIGLLSPISCQGWGSNIDQQRDALPKPLVDPLPPYRPELPPRLLGDVVEPTPNLVIPDKPGQDMGVMFKRLLVGPLVLKPDRWAVIPRFKLECCSVWCPRYFRNDDAVLGLMHSMLAQGGLPRFTCSRIVVSLGQSDHPHTTSRSTTQTEPTLIIAELLFDGSVRRRIFGMLSPGSFSAAFTEDMGWFVSRVLQFPTLVEKVLDPGWMNFTPKPQPMQLLSSGCFHALLTLFESSKRLPLLPMWLLQRVFKQLESMSKVEILTAALASDYSSNVLPKRQEFDFSSKYGLGLTDGANVDNIFWTGGAPEAQTYRGLTDLQINRLFLLYAHFLLSYPEEYSLRMPRTRLKFPYFEQAFAEQLTKEINGNKELIRTWLQVIVLLLKRTPSIFKLVEKQPTPL